MSRYSFPFPVLGAGDDVTSEIGFSGDPRISYTTQDLELRFRLRTDDSDLRQLVSERAVAIKAKWSCTATMSSGYLDLSEVDVKHDGWKFITSLDQRLVRNSVDVEVLAVANRDFSNFRWRGTNEEFGPVSWQMRAGDVVAVFGSFRFNVEKQYDPLNPPLGSLLRIQIDNTQRESMLLNFNEDEYVVVTLSPDAGSKMQFQDDSVKVSLLVMPALLQMVSDVKNDIENTDSDGVFDLAWKTTLWRLMESAGVTSEADTAFDVARRLLNDPLTKTLEDLEKVRD